MTDNQMRDVLRKLAHLQREGQLSEFLVALRHECMSQGTITPPPFEERQKLLEVMDLDAHLRARELSKIAAEVFGLPLGQCEAAAREVFVFDPWRRIAIDVLAGFTADEAEVSSSGKLPEQSSPKQARGRAW